MKKIAVFIISGFSIFMVALSAGGCSTTSYISEKSGVQLWTENCNRCHYMASPANFKDQQWDKIGTHMRVRANLTEDEVDKIIEFLKASN